MAIEDQNGKLLEGKAEILERYADYYEDLLSSQTAMTEEEKSVESEVEKEFKELFTRGKCPGTSQNIQGRHIQSH